MTDKSSYGQILKSSSIMGGAASITMLLGMIKTKFAAVLIGTAGVGLLTSFTVIQGLVGTIAGLGINQSAVRDVAAAVAKDDQQAIGRTVLTLRRMCWLTGLLGMVTVVAVSPLIGQFTFGSDKYNLEIAALGLIILFVNITGGQTSLIQGSRRIGDIARLQIIGAAVGTVITIGFYFWIGLRGIVPALVLAAAIQLLISWWYAKRIPVPKVQMTWRESFTEAGSMVKLGVAMMWTGLVGSLVTYATVAMITDQFDLHAVGIYSAAFALSGMFVNFVLQAMGADYYPRLAGVTHDKEAMNRLVNEQTEIGILLAVPGILAILVLAPWIIQFFYTKEFLQAVDLLQWFILGCLGRVISWPMGYIMLATGSAKWLVVSESFIHLLHILMIWFALNTFGLEGVGIAFFLLYAVHIVVAYGIAKHLISFGWSWSVFMMFLKTVLLFMIVFLFVKYFSMMAVTTLGLLGVVIITTIICFRALILRTGTENRLVQSLFKIPGMRFILEW